MKRKQTSSLTFTPPKPKIPKTEMNTMTSVHRELVKVELDFVKSSYSRRYIEVDINSRHDKIRDLTRILATHPDNAPLMQPVVTAMVTRFKSSSRTQKRFDHDRIIHNCSKIHALSQTHVFANAFNDMFLYEINKNKHSDNLRRTFRIGSLTFNASKRCVDSKSKHDTWPKQSQAIYWHSHTLKPAITWYHKMIRDQTEKNIVQANLRLKMCARATNSHHSTGIRNETPCELKEMCSAYLIPLSYDVAKKIALFKSMLRRAQRLVDLATNLKEFHSRDKNVPLHTRVWEGIVKSVTKFPRSLYDSNSRLASLTKITLCTHMADTELSNDAKLLYLILIEIMHDENCYQFDRREKMKSFLDVMNLLMVTGSIKFRKSTNNNFALFNVLSMTNLLDGLEFLQFNERLNYRMTHFRNKDRSLLMQQKSGYLFDLQFINLQPKTEGLGSDDQFRRSTCMHVDMTTQAILATECKNMTPFFDDSQTSLSMRIGRSAMRTLIEDDAVEQPHKTGFAMSTRFPFPDIGKMYHLVHATQSRRCIKNSVVSPDIRKITETSNLQTNWTVIRLAERQVRGLQKVLSKVFPDCVTNIVFNYFYGCESVEDTSSQTPNIAYLAATALCDAFTVIHNEKYEPDVMFETPNEYQTNTQHLFRGTRVPVIGNMLNSSRLVPFIWNGRQFYQRHLSPIVSIKCEMSFVADSLSTFMNEAVSC